ncbi:MAG: hypothetical protein PHD82_02335 [Candidatus Riflebacteria bacterium]|jgi:hypothetical protein|nr:hypothetical protein [Candidatus Riflebacteria bacterium]
MRLKLSILKALLMVCALNLPVVFSGESCQAQVASSTGQQNNATDTQELKKNNPAETSSISAQGNDSESQFTQNNDSMSLEERIAIFNKRYCPPETTITEITDFSLARLVKVELIKRSELDTFKNMVIINGKVYVKEDKPAAKPEPKPGKEPKTEPIGKAGKNLFGELEAACDQLAQNKNRGQTDGNKKPERVLELKRRKITYRDKENQLREMEVYSPPKFPAKKKALAGKKGKIVKDYATSILVPKNQQGSTKDITAFDDMPSADAWLDDNDTPTQK